jgi:ABC-2 type transport system permease protein
MKPVIEVEPILQAPPRRGFELGALAALAGLTLRQHLRGRRLLILSLLFLVPSILPPLLRLAQFPPTAAELEFALVFNLIPHALAPLTALLYAAGIIQDEVEDQTLTYLLLRPLPRWALYLTKLAVTWVVTSLLAGVFTVLALVVIHWYDPGLWGEVLPGRALKVMALVALGQAGYCPLFGLLGLLTRRALIAGLAYIAAIEGLLATFESVVRRLTVMYYLRVLAVRWLEPDGHQQLPIDLSRASRPGGALAQVAGWGQKWSIDLSLAPSAAECVLTLLVAGAFFAVLGALLMMRQEFRMKTPEGS